MNISFLYPQAIIFGILILFLYWKFYTHKNLLRTILLVLICLILTQPYISRNSDALDVIAVVDRSQSISNEGKEKQKELLSLVTDKLQPNDNIAIISFNEKGFIETGFTKSINHEYKNPYSSDLSDLSDGLKTANSLINPKRQTKILLLSDGEYTGINPQSEALIAKNQNAPIFYRDLMRSNINNLFVSDILVPSKVLSNEPFKILFKVSSTSNVAGRYRITKNNKILDQQINNGWKETNFKIGDNFIPITDINHNAGLFGYHIEVEMSKPIVEQYTDDNKGGKFVNVLGEKSVLIVNNTGQPDNLSRVLTAGNIPVHITGIGNYRLQGNNLYGYKGIILNNVNLTKMTRKQIEDIKNFVINDGGGLLVCGGNQSFQAGGFYKSPLEEILPVSLEDRKHTKKMTGAFSFVLDRSGSMAVPVGTGVTKMDLANAAAVESLNILSGGDSISVIAVDSEPHVIVDQQNIADAAKIGKDIRSIRSQGGGIYVHVGLTAAGRELLKAKQSNKHILLFSDAADSEEPGNYKQLLKEYKDAGISVSVVGLGKETDPDADLLKDIAKEGGGTAYFTEDPKQLIQFFTADTINYTRQSFVEEPAPMKILPIGAYALSSTQEWQDFSSSHYNLLFPKDKADIAITTADSDPSPVLAFWQKGLGRVATLSPDTDAAFAHTSNYADIVLASGRWIMGSNVYDSYQATSRLSGNYATIKLELSEEEKEKAGNPILVMTSPSGTTSTHHLQWKNRNELEAQIKLTEQGAWKGSVQVGEKTFRIDPVSLPTSPEFNYNNSQSGKQALSEIASLSGGGEIQDISDFLKRRKQTVSEWSIVPLLLLILLLVFLIELADNRFSLLDKARNALKLKQLKMAANTRAKFENLKTQDAENKNYTKAIRQRRRKPVMKMQTDTSATDETPKIVPSAGSGGSDSETFNESLLKAKKRNRN